MKDTPISRRDFLKNMGIAGAGAFLAASPWLSAFSEVTNTSSEKCRLAIIGPGSRGRFLMSFLVKNPKVDIVALCDIYQPSIDEALKLAPKAKVYGNYKEVLEDKNILRKVNRLYDGRVLPYISKASQHRKNFLHRTATSL